MTIDVQTLEQILFWVFAVLFVGSAIAMILQRNPVKGALFLVMNFFTLAGLYLLLKAQFVAVIQIIVYAGAIMVLFLFVIMLLNLGDESKLREKISLNKEIAMILSAAVLAVLVTIILEAVNVLPLPAPAEVANELGTVETIGKTLYTKYLFPFEITALVLISAVIGSVLLAKKKLD